MVKFTVLIKTSIGEDLIIHCRLFSHLKSPLMYFGLREISQRFDDMINYFDMREPSIKTFILSVYAKIKEMQNQTQTCILVEFFLGHFIQKIRRMVIMLQFNTVAQQDLFCHNITSNVVDVVQDAELQKVVNLPPSLKFILSTFLI